MTAIDVKALGFRSRTMLGHGLLTFRCLLFPQLLLTQHHRDRAESSNNPTSQPYCMYAKHNILHPFAPTQNTLVEEHRSTLCISVMMEYEN